MSTSEQQAEILDAIFSTLETAAFCCVEQAEAEDLIGTEGSMYESVVTISGDVSGHVTSSADHEFVMSLADGMLGPDGEADNLEQQHDCLNELSNIICVPLVGLVTHDHHRYIFSHPAIDTLSPEQWKAHCNQHSAINFNGLDGCISIHYLINIES